MAVRRLAHSWDYLWRTTPLHRRELRGTEAEDAPPPLPAGVSTDGLQAAADGVGTLFRRRYRTCIRDARFGAADLVARITEDPNLVAPTEFARFTKVHGDEGPMQVGDEYLVRMPGPWNGPVRVVARTPTSFRLASLEGHLEAGQVELRAEGPAGESCAAPSSRGPAAATVSGSCSTRTCTWPRRSSCTCGPRCSSVPPVSPAAVRPAGSTSRRTVSTRSVTTGGRWATPAPGRCSTSSTTRRSTSSSATAAGSRRRPAGRWTSTASRCRPSPRATRFPAAAGRSPGASCGTTSSPTPPSSGRGIDGRQVRVWGWNYRTLQGYLEMGQMDYELWKWVDTGDVEFHTCRFSRRASVGNPVVRLGLWLFGRRRQVQFAQRACERMARLTEEALAGRPGAAGVPRAGELIEVAAR